MIVVPSEVQFKKIYGNIFTITNVAARCACVACNSCTCACSCRLTLCSMITFWCIYSVC